MIPFLGRIPSRRLGWRLPDIEKLPDDAENFLGVPGIKLILADFAALNDFEACFLQVGDRL